MKPIVDWNRKVLSGNSVKKITDYSSPNLEKKIGNIDLWDYDFSTDDKVWQNQLGDYEIALFYKDMLTFDLLSFDGGNLTISIQKTASLPCPYGQNLSEIIPHFDKNTYFITTHTKGAFYVIPKQGLFFNFDKEERLMEWGIFFR